MPKPCKRGAGQVMLKAFVLALTFGINAPQLKATEDIDTQVLVHHSVELPSNFTTSTLRAIFSGRMQRWPNGSRIKVFVLPQDHQLHQNFCRQTLRTFPYVLQRQWDQQTFTGSGAPPTEIATSYQLHEQVSRTSGAIGYGRLNTTSGSWIQFVGGEPTKQSPGVLNF